jgi:hypothetical protein
MDSILRNKTVYYVDRYVLSSCNASQYLSIHLRLRDYWYEIKPETYLIKVTYTPENRTLAGLCTIGFLPSSDPNIVSLGSVFLRNYYVIFDLDKD